MPTDRGRNTAVAALVDGQQPGGYRLPNELIEAVTRWRHVQTITPTPPQPGDVDAAAARWLATGRPLAETARELLAERASQAQHRAEAEVLAAAKEQAASAAVMAAADSYGAAISALGAALTEVLDEASEAATHLPPGPASVGQMALAPAKVRSAWLTMQQSAGRYAVIRRAQRLAASAAAQQIAKDTSGVFHEMKNPMALDPAWRPGLRLSPLPHTGDSDPIERLRWLAGPDGRACEPWLPTCQQQDQRWTDVFDARRIEHNGQRGTLMTVLR